MLNDKNKLLVEILKASPGADQVYVNRMLAGLSLAYIQDLSDFVGDRIAPIYPVNKISGIYTKYGKEDFMSTQAEGRGFATDPALREYSIDNTATYLCQKNSISKLIADELRATQDEPVNMDRDAVQVVTRDLILSKEKLIIANLMASTSYVNTWAGVSGVPSTNQFKKWSAASGADPVADVLAAQKLVRKTTGQRLNKMVVSFDVFEVLLANPVIREMIKYLSVKTGELLASYSNFAQLFQVDEFMVSAASDGTNFLFNNMVVLTHIAPPGILSATAAITFSFNSDGFAGESVMIKKVREEKKDADLIIGTTYFHPKVVCSDLGITFTAVV